MLDFEQSFSDKKRAWQGRGVYSKIPASYPKLKTNPPVPRSQKAVIKDLFPRYSARYAAKADLIQKEDADSEMGVFPLIASLIPMATNLVGSLFGKKSTKTGQPPPEANTAKQILDALTQAGAIGGDKDGGPDIKEIVKNIVMTIPSPVIAQVKAAIAEMKDKTVADESARDLIAAKIDTKFQPQITALLASLKAADVQKQATYEHKNLKAKEAFRTGTTTSLNTALLSLQNVSKRLSAIETRLQKSAIVNGATRQALLGGKSVIEG